MNQEELARCVGSGRLLPILEAYERSESVRHGRWLLDGLRRALDRADPGSVPLDVVERLEAIAMPPEALQGVREAPPAQSVHIPLVAGEQGFCRLMMVTYDPPGSLGAEDALDPDARLAVADALREAGERLPGRSGTGFRFGPVRIRSLDGFRIHGSSLGAGAFVSAYSVWSRRAVRSGTAVTGCLFEGRLISVGGMDAKVRTLVGRGDIRRIVVPSADLGHASAVAVELGLACEVIGVSSLDELLEACVSPSPSARRHIDKEVSAARTEFDEAWPRWRWPAVRERLGRLLFEIPAGRPDLRVKVLTMLGASYRHLGDARAALDSLGEALAVLTTDEGEAAVGDYDRSFLHRHLALVYKQLFRFEEAEEAALAAIAAARAARNVGARTSALGTAGLVALAAGDVRAALSHFEDALRHASDFDRDRAPRSGAYVVLGRGRDGDLDSARAQYRATLALIGSLGASDRTRGDEQWLRTYMAEAAYLCASPREVREVLSAPCVEEAMDQLPLPGLLARRWLGLAEVATGDVEQGLSRLASGPSVHPHTKAEHVKLTAHLGVLYEAEARAARGLMDDDARGRALLALEHLPSGPEAEAFCGAAVERVRALLGDHRSPVLELREGLGALLALGRALE